MANEKEKFHNIEKTFLIVRKLFLKPVNVSGGNSDI